MNLELSDEKKAVHDFWDRAACGEELYLSDHSHEDYQNQTKIRYALEPFILDFAEFNQYQGKKVLEIGVGLGADHQKYAEGGAYLSGIDLTKRSIEHTRRRFQALGLVSELRVADAENLPFDDKAFDLVYSWGVLHHSPDTVKAINELFRVLRQDGTAKIMIYHKYSFVGFMLWFKYALLKLKPTTPLKIIYSQYLESPGTKAYSTKEARKLFKKFQLVEINTVLTHGDLLYSSAGQRHKGLLLSVARLIWPRWFIRRFLSKYGLFMLISAKR